MLNINTPARAAPPASLHRPSLGWVMAVVVAAVVFTVKTVVPLPPGMIVTLVGLKPQVGRLCALVGEPVSVQLKFIVPW
jgi:hypothetical protein